MKRAPKSVERAAQKPVERPNQKTTVEKSTSPKIPPTRLSISVSEPESEIFLSDDEGNIFEDAESYVTGEDGAPLVYDDFPPGTYTLTVRKPGFIEQTQEIRVTAGRANAFSITLRPFSPERLLAQAQSELEAGNYRKSAALAENILEARPDNAKAKLLLGSSLFYLPETREAAAYLASAVGSGETVSLPVNIYGKEKGIVQLSPGNLIVDKNSVTFKGTGGGSVSSFVLTRGKINNLADKSDEYGIAYVEFEGEGIFNGRGDRRKLRLYSPDAFVKGAKIGVNCPACEDGPCPCQTKNGVIFRLLDKWRRADFSAGS